ncbi:MAG: hypothetical protein JWM88_1081 [Verrucomicrobia bacterium]|nr:hypothetical protein [Verrucomicrobiota bacterium]
MISLRSLIFAVATPVLVALAHGAPRREADFQLLSPDRRIEVTVWVGEILHYAVKVDGQGVIADSRLGLKLTVGLDDSWICLQNRRRTADASWENRFGKRRQVRDHFNELRLTVRQGLMRTLELVFRAYDDGVAFCYVLPAPDGLDLPVLDEELTEFAFAGDYPCYAGEDRRKRFASPQEWTFPRRRLKEITPDSLMGLPLLVQTPAAWVAITESNLRDWSGLWLSGTASAGRIEPAPAAVLRARLAPRLDGGGLVKLAPPHTSPWRVIMIGREPGRLVESDLVLNLAAPCELEDVSWIKPGVMAWDHWWSGGVQMDTATIKSYIQLAADMGWPYQLIDWHWYEPISRPSGDITKVAPELDLPEVRRFAREKNVRLWLWLHWEDVDRNDAYKKAFSRYEEWGIAGVKIDFMERDDQEMVAWCEKITRAAAEHHLLVNFHGASKPTGFNRTFPNQITREGLLGNEQNRSKSVVTPEHKLTLPFTRFLAGPGDFTPGGFLNRQPAQFQVDKNAAQVQGTRAAELALFVIYDSPVCCACDSPEHYRDQPGVDFLKRVPTVWDETKVLDAAVGEHLAMVRQAGNSWFLGALTNRTAREIPLKLDFLGEGRWKLRLWQDAADCAVNPEHLDVIEQEVTPESTLLLRLAPAGGAVAWFEPMARNAKPPPSP